MFRGLFSNKVGAFPNACRYWLVASDLTRFDIVSSIALKDHKSVASYFLVSPEAVFHFGRRMWLARGSINCFTEASPLIYVLYKTISHRELFIKIGFRNHPRHLPLDSLIGYIEKKTKLLAFTDCEDAGVFIIPVTCSTGKADEALLKAELQNTQRFHVTPSNRHESLQNKSNMLEYLHLHSCSVDDLAEELRAWSDLPMLSPYRSVPAGTNQ